MRSSLVPHRPWLLRESISAPQSRPTHSYHSRCCLCPKGGASAQSRNDRRHQLMRFCGPQFNLVPDGIGDAESQHTKSSRQFDKSHIVYRSSPNAAIRPSGKVLTVAALLPSVSNYISRPLDRVPSSVRVKHVLGSSLCNFPGLQLLLANRSPSYSSALFGESPGVDPKPRCTDQPVAPGSSASTPFPHSSERACHVCCQVRGRLRGYLGYLHSPSARRPLRTIIP